MSRVAGTHHVLGIKQLEGQLRHGLGAEGLVPAGREGREAGHEEVEAREGHHVDRQLS